MTEKRIEKIKRVVALRRTDLVIVLEDIYDPHNAAAIFRTCDSFGIQDVYIISENEKMIDPKKVGKKSSSSANKWIDFHMYTNTKECVMALKRKNFTVVGSVLREGAQTIYGYTWPEKTALILGNEHNGLSQQAQKMCDQVIYIPMSGMVQSLNVSVAAGILIADLCTKHNKNDYFLRSVEQTVLVTDFLKRA